MNRQGEIDRRRMLMATAAAAFASALPLPAAAQKAPAKAGAAAAPAAAGPSPSGVQLKFFTRAEYDLLDELGEMILPADERSGGARAAKVAEFLDVRIGESLDPAWKQSWRDDLREIERIANEMFGRAFLKCSFEQRTRLLERISRNEKSPKEPGEFAFGTIKWSVAEAYYRTRIGIHDELDYRGNQIQDEFSGFDPSKG